MISAVAGPELADVSTYQASGNVLFETEADPHDLESVLEERLEARRALAATAGETDTLRPRDRETIWTHVGGMMDSPLAALTPAPGAPVTTVRTAGTIERLVAKFR